MKPLLLQVTRADIQRVVRNPQSAVIVAVTDDHRVLVYREPDGQVRVRVKQGDSQETIPIA